MSHWAHLYPDGYAVGPRRLQNSQWRRQIYRLHLVAPQSYALGSPVDPPHLKLVVADLVDLSHTDVAMQVLDLWAARRGAP